MRGLAIGLLLFLGSCGTVQTLAGACDVASATLLTANDLRQQGKLKPTDISRINVAVQIINPICASPYPPVDASAVIVVVSKEAAVVASLIGVK